MTTEMALNPRTDVTTKESIGIGSSMRAKAIHIVKGCDLLHSCAAAKDIMTLGSIMPYHHSGITLAKLEKTDLWRLQLRTEMRMGCS
jgi:hypothetical protein